MAVRDDIREHRKLLKGKGKKAYVEYFMMYYKWPTIIILCCCIILFSMVRNIIENSKERTIYGIFMNCYPDANNELLADEFAAFLDINQKNHPIFFDIGLTYNPDATTQIEMITPVKVMAIVDAKEGDFMINTEVSFSHFASNGYYLDLRNILTEEQINKYEKDFIYFDVENIGNIPVGINISDSNFVKDSSFYTHSTNVIFSIFYNAEQIDNAMLFLEYIYTPNNFGYTEDDNSIF